MLTLSRHRNEEIVIGDDIIICVVDIRPDKVRIGIKAPDHISIHRREIYDAIKRGESFKERDAKSPKTDKESD